MNGPSALKEIIWQFECNVIAFLVIFTGPDSTHNCSLKNKGLSLVQDVFHQLPDLFQHILNGPLTVADKGLISSFPRHMFFSYGLRHTKKTRNPSFSMTLLSYILSEF